MGNENENSKVPPQVVLSGTSPIQVRFIGWLVIVIAGGFGGWIWWAAAMSTKLDVVISNQAAQLTMLKDVTADVYSLKEWRVQIDTVGSPAIVRRLEKVDMCLHEMEKELALRKLAKERTP